MTENLQPYIFDTAIVRQPCEAVVNGLRDGDAGDPTFAGVAAEHVAYVAALERAGVEVTTLPALEDYPDSIFVEDPALVFASGAILLHPGAPTRQGETTEIEPVLRDHFETVLQLPCRGFADGGDILVTPERVIIGLSARTDKQGAEDLQGLLAQLGQTSEIVRTPPDVLHFKTDCGLLDEARVLTTARLAASGVFYGLDPVIVPSGEEAVANALRVNDIVMLGQDFPRTIDLLDAKGYEVVALPTSEIGKLDAGLSCMSLRWKRPA